MLENFPARPNMMSNLRNPVDLNRLHVVLPKLVGPQVTNVTSNPPDNHDQTSDTDKKIEPVKPGL